MFNILILDDDDHVLKSLRRLLRRPDYALSCFSDVREALAQCSVRSFDLILSDQRMPGMNGTDFFKEIAARYPHTRRLLISGYSDFSSVVDAFNDGTIHKFIVKPWNNDKLKALVEEQLTLLDAKQPVTAPAQNRVTAAVEESQPLSSFHGIVTEDPALLEQLGIIAKTADSNAAFFINGETGTGKERVATAIHLQSDRANAPFVAFNCANLTETLLESQLFGHKKGSFTGAAEDQLGLLAEAEGGTLFLDEVTEIPLGLQAKLLRVLQEREYLRIGDTKPTSF